MIDDFEVRYLTEWEFSQAIETNKRFETYYTPYLFIRILYRYNENIFDALICRSRSFEMSGCLKKGDSNSIVPEYYDKKNAAFTFDGMRFFKIINISESSDYENVYVFKFQYINTPSFTERNTVFMIMPFGHDTLDKFYEKNIKTYLKDCNLGLQVRRSDDFSGIDVVADTILEQIKKAEFIICDITHCNKNVFFEIGYAKALNKNMIFLLEQNKPAEFFDVNHIRRIEYSYLREPEFQYLLRDTLISVRNNRLL